MAQHKNIKSKAMGKCSGVGEAGKLPDRVRCGLAQTLEGTPASFQGARLGLSQDLRPLPPLVTRG